MSWHQGFLSSAPGCSRDGHCPCLLPAPGSAEPPPRREKFTLQSGPPKASGPSCRQPQHPPKFHPWTSSASRQLRADVYGTGLGLSRGKLRLPAKLLLPSVPHAPTWGSRCLGWTRDRSDALSPPIRGCWGLCLPGRPRPDPPACRAASASRHISLWLFAPLVLPPRALTHSFFWFSHGKWGGDPLKCPCPFVSPSWGPVASSRSTGPSRSGPWGQPGPSLTPPAHSPCSGCPGLPPLPPPHQLSPSPRSVVGAWGPRPRSHVPKARCLGPRAPPRTSPLCLLPKRAQKSGFSQQQTRVRGPSTEDFIRKTPEKETRREPGEAGWAAGPPQPGLARSDPVRGAGRRWVGGQEPGHLISAAAGEPWSQCGRGGRGLPATEWTSGPLAHRVPGGEQPSGSVAAEPTLRQIPQCTR